MGIEPISYIPMISITIGVDLIYNPLSNIVGAVFRFDAWRWFASSFTWNLARSLPWISGSRGESKTSLLFFNTLERL
jgi:hypothetical protein